MWSITALSSDSSSALSGTLPGRSSLRARSDSSVSACEMLAGGEHRQQRHQQTDHRERDQHASAASFDRVRASTSGRWRPGATGPPLLDSHRQRRCPHVLAAVARVVRLARDHRRDAARRRLGRGHDASAGHQSPGRCRWSTGMRPLDRLQEARRSAAATRPRCRRRRSVRRSPAPSRRARAAAVPAITCRRTQAGSRVGPETCHHRVGVSLAGERVLDVLAVCQGDRAQLHPAQCVAVGHQRHWKPTPPSRPSTCVTWFR